MRQIPCWPGFPEPSANTKTEALRIAAQRLVACGLTTVTDAGLDVDDIALLDSLHQSGDLKLRVVAMANPTESNFQAMAQRGGWDTPRLKAQSFKFYMDGALGSRGAALLEPYDDRPGHRGLLLQSMEEYEAQLKENPWRWVPSCDPCHWRFRCADRVERVRTRVGWPQRSSLARGARPGHSSRRLESVWEVEHHSPLCSRPMPRRTCIGPGSGSAAAAFAALMPTPT